MNRERASSSGLPFVDPIVGRSVAVRFGRRQIGRRVFDAFHVAGVFDKVFASASRTGDRVFDNVVATTRAFDLTDRVLFEINTGAVGRIDRVRRVGVFGGGGFGHAVA